MAFAQPVQRAHITPRRDTHAHNSSATTPRVKQLMMKSNNCRKSLGEASTQRRSYGSMPGAAAASVDGSYQEDEAGFNLRKADFPILSGTDDRLAPLPAPRSTCNTPDIRHRDIRPVTPQRGAAYATVLCPELAGGSQASGTLYRPHSQTDLMESQGAERGRRMSAPQPYCTQRSASQDGSHLSAQAVEAKRKAAEVMDARYRIETLKSRMLTTARQCQAQGEYRDRDVEQSFLSDHQQMMADIQVVFGTEKDLPGYAALTLMLLALPRQNGGTLLASEPVSYFPQSNAAFSFAPVPTTPDTQFRSIFGESSEARARSGSAGGERPGRHSTGLMSMHGSRSVHTLEPFQQPAKKAAPVAAAEEKKRSRRISTYKVVNPQTGEEYAIKTGTSFTWAQTKRLPIVDPKTGVEVVPSGWQSAVAAGRCISPREMQVHDQRPARCSVSSSCVSSGSGVEESSQGEERMNWDSIQHGFLCEPFCGGYWDWPLSRQEKKERILWLTQLELLSELDELRYPGGADGAADASQQKSVR